MIEEIAKFIFRLIFEVLFSLTGESVLFLITLGKHKPRWGIYAEDSPSRFVIFSEISLWIGIAFWITVIALTYTLLRET